jgi:phage recombination protein Bet
MRVARKFTPDEIKLIHRTQMAGASPDDVALFVATCERTGLDPFARQIMPSSRNTNKNGAWVTVWNYLVTIDGLRKIAVDSGDYEGQEGPFWCGKDGAWKEIWTADTPCFAAKVLVHRRGFRVGLAGIARYDAYVQKKKDGTPNQVWSTLSDHMTAKCAEALALRRAYPNEMAGLYTEDEGEIIEHTAPVEEPVVQAWVQEELESAKASIGDLAEKLMEWGLAEEEMHKAIQKPKDLIGNPEVTFNTWSSRFLALSERLRVKHEPKPVEVPAELMAHDA